MSEEKFDFSNTPKQPGIYKIHNKKNGKDYVGSSVNVRRRWRDHLSGFRGKYHNNAHLQSAWNKYGESAFEFVVLERVEEKEDLVEQEQFWIDKLNSFERGYNILPKAESRLGYTHTEEAKRKMSKAKRRDNHPMYGKKLSKKTRRKMSEAHKGKTFLEKTRRRMSEAQRGQKNPMYGKKHTEESIEQMSLSTRATRIRKIKKRDERKGQLQLFRNLDFGYES